MTDRTLLDAEEVAGAGLDGWALRDDALLTRLVTPADAVGLELVARIGAAAEAANHHPDLDLRYGHLDVRLSSHDAGGVTRRDVDLARTIDAIAAELGAEARPG